MRLVHRGNENPRSSESQERAPAPVVEPQSLVLKLPELPDLQLPLFPCTMPGCMRYGELGYHCQIHLDEHLILFHGMPPDLVFPHLEPAFVASLPMNNGLGHTQGHQQAFHQDAYPQLDLAGIYNEGHSETVDGAPQGVQIEGGLDFDFH
ncbi:hypothetical protein F5Y09DRAFT_325238 [Xylaria sp. FL1042]|nr:hypothetical protein F5Y09DRAFT_325238 [Xylaria sp. FL1042]